MNYRNAHRLTTAKTLLLATAGVMAVAGPVLVGILNVPQTRAESKIERLLFEVPSVKRADASAGGHTSSDVPDARGEGVDPLLLAQIVPARTTKPKELALSSAPRIEFERVPQPVEAPSANVSGPLIEALEFEGASRIARFALRAMVASRVGRVYDVETLRRDTQALYNTQRFSDVFWRTDTGPAGVVVRFVLVERPLIKSIDYQGDDTVTIADILERFKQRNIRLRAETLYHEVELWPAAATVQELVAERGRRGIKVTPFVEPVPPSDVKISFRVEEKQ